MGKFVYSTLKYITFCNHRIDKTIFYKNWVIRFYALTLKCNHRDGDNYTIK